MSDDAQLQLGFDTTGVKQGGQETVRSLNDIKKAAQQTTDSIDKIGSQSEVAFKRQRAAQQSAFYEQVEAEKKMTEARVQQFKEQIAQERNLKIKGAQTTAKAVAMEYTQELDAGFKRDMARLKADQIQQFITPAEAKNQARMIATAYNEELATRMRSIGLNERMGAAGMKGTVAGGEVVGIMGQSVKTIEEVGKKSIFAGAGLGRLRYSFASLAAQAAGVTPILGRVGSVMGSMAFGSVWVIGILAAIAAIGYAYQKLAADSIAAAERVKDAWSAAKSVADKVRGVGGPAATLAAMKEGNATADQNSQKWLDRANATSKFGQTNPKPSPLTLDWFGNQAMSALTLPWAAALRAHGNSLAGETVTNRNNMALANPVLEAETRSTRIESLTKRMGSQKATADELKEAKQLMNTSLAGFSDPKLAGNDLARDKNLENYDRLKSAFEALENKGRAVTGVVHGMDEAFLSLQNESKNLSDSVLGQDGKLSHFDDVLAKITTSMGKADYAYEHLASKMKTKSVTAEHTRIHGAYAGMLSEVTGARGVLSSNEQSRIRDQMTALEAAADKNPAEHALAEYNHTLKESSDRVKEAKSISADFGAEIQSQADAVNAAASAHYRMSLAIEHSRDVMDAFKRPGADHSNVSGLLAERASLERQRNGAVYGSEDWKKYQSGADEVNKLIHQADTWGNHMQDVIDSAGKHFESSMIDTFTRIEMGGQKSFTSILHSIRDLYLATSARLTITHAIDSVRNSDWFKKNVGMRDDHGDFKFNSSKWGKVGGYANAGAQATFGAYSVGQNAGSVGMGGLMGGMQGAAAGAEIAGPVGAVVGGAIGMVSGMMGASSAAKQAAKQMKEARESFGRTMADYVATANKTNSDLQKSLSSSDATRQSLIAQANQAYSGKKNETQRNQMIDTINKAAADEAKNLKEKFLQDLTGQFNALNGNGLTAQIDAINLAYQQNKNAIAAAGGSMDDYNKALGIQKTSIENATRAYNLSIQTTGQELQARKLEATGRSYEAAQLRQQIEQEKQLADFTEKYANSNPQLIEQLKQVQALEKANGAISLESAVRGGPTGFKVAAYAYEFASVANQIGDAVKHGIDELLKNPPVTINLPGTTIEVTGAETPDQLLKKVVGALQIVKNSSLGINGKNSDALNLVAAS